MTPNGSLMAYTLPANMRELRDQVALVSISWKENLERKDAKNYEASDDEELADAERRVIQPDTLETLTIEFDNRNIIVKYLQSKLLLVLEGGVPPGWRKPLKVTVEAPGDARYPPDDQSNSQGSSLTNSAILGTSVGSQASTTASAASHRRLGVLAIQRRKMEIMAQTIKDELQQSGFQMPDDPMNKFF